MDDIPKFKYVIIGGGIAGVSCSELLYGYDKEESILLITASNFVKTVTNIQHVTKILESFDIKESSTDSLQNQFPRLSIIKSSVTSLDSKNKIVNVGDKKYGYDKLCICTGATPKVIFPENPNVLWIRDTESVKKFQERISTAKRIVVVGNGGIATELVYEVTGIEIIWAIKDKSINSVFMDAGAAEFLRSNLDTEKLDVETISKRRKYTINPSEEAIDTVLGGALGPDWHEGVELKGKSKRTVTIETEVEVRRILSYNELEQTLNEEKKWPVYVELTNGKIFGCDFVVSATGVEPNTDVFLKGNNFKLGDDGGLLVNGKMETSVRDVFAAGDVCTAGWDTAKHWFQLRLWTQAKQMGCYAGKCMWASTVEIDDIYLDFCFEMFSHVTKFLGQNVVLLGLFNGQTLDGKYEILLRMTKGKEYIKCVMQDGRIQGAILIGETGLEETFEHLLLNKMDLSSFGEDLLDPSVDLEDYFD